ncbi:MAG: hypothetical protein RR595_09165 [Lysinibacillus sp.]
MNKFIGLIKKEWALYKTWLFIAIIAGLTIIILIPFALEKFVKGPFEVTNVQPGLAYIVLILGGLYSIMQFLASLRYDIHSKEIWLHSTSSIAQLIGAKIIFILIGYSIFNIFFTTLGLFVSRQYIQADFDQYLFLLLGFVGFAAIMQLSLLIIVLFFYAVYLQTKRYIGRFAVIISTFFFFLSMYLSIRFIESPIYVKLFYYGEINLKPLISYLPRFNDDTIYYNFGSIYIVDQLTSLLTTLLLYIIATKWIEKVVLK